jgi:quercetin dioxygenase-like cupin family protein
MKTFGGRRFDEPDDIRNFPLSRVEIIHFGYMTAARTTLQPGWRWSEHVKPIVGTESCQHHHNGYILEGRIGVRMDDGRTFEYGPGDAFEILPGHDSWTIGDQPVINIEFSPVPADFATTGE